MVGQSVNSNGIATTSVQFNVLNRNTVHGSDDGKIQKCKQKTLNGKRNKNEKKKLHFKVYVCYTVDP